MTGIFVTALLSASATFTVSASVVEAIALREGITLTSDSTATIGLVVGAPGHYSISTTIIDNESVVVYNFE